MAYPSGYTFRDSYPSIYQKDRDAVVTLEVYRDGALVAPSSATLTLRSETGVTLSTPTVTIVGSIPTATILAAALDSLGEGYREQWDITIAGIVYTKYRDGAVCRSPLQMPITDADLVAGYPDLAQNLGTSATNFQSFLDKAWGKTLRKLRSGGKMPYVIVSSSALYDAVLEWTLHLIYTWWYGQTGGVHFKELADEHRSNFNEEWGSLSFEVDLDQDGVADDRDRETASNAAIITPNASPNRRRGKRRSW
jgi:hypothetical protein